MLEAIIILLFIFIFVMGVISELKHITLFDAVGTSAIWLINTIKSLAPTQDTYYPTGIGYDVNGTFSPGMVESEFNELGDILEALYLDNQTWSNELYRYDFKFARTINDIGGKDLYCYIDKHVISIVKRYLHRIGNNRVSDNISSITLDTNCLTVYIARTPKGEQMNYEWRNRQLNSFNEANIENKADRGPIVITWETA
ncbi:MAG: hypothetical protein E7304_05860 [Butyrivibrio sp.]|uniref:hypothetical protein n=1 Tax=Butyrivibrio sp. TaxID=28121 RepID=UPI001EC04C75|nr:hypothetical protein [Butyrivibrio sp.]MBE5840916.1 hypothetical protein [Butyrivibrio sp.]